ncbi:NAD(P)-dependent dehydrogenase, short-chain alcohol dehydrogenase family [Mucilaginibacter gossypii]|uniref:NAD(P)-dependent dehydrogenase, short-chain alcohol dehydrogenase family n=2 Tax=Sphingobacteriaceae TaxID=84566 RepID=A0A1G7UAR7_9SPHI|nr:NAD(P)-dependent dehydrogenase, short-chain alcohol dehydrogenase family [Mucilaginibacter gossypii]
MVPVTLNIWQQGKDGNMKNSKNVIVLTGAGQLGMAIARRMGYGNKIFVADWKIENAQAISKTLTEAGFDVVPFKVDISSRESVQSLIKAARKEGEIAIFINAAGVSPSQASIEQILKVDLYGTSLLLEEFGKVIKYGGTAVVISSQSGYRMPALTADEDRLLATTPTEQLLQLELLKPENIKDTLHAYQMAKRANGKRVMAEAVKWGERGARVNAISPGIIITPLALDEINGPRGDFYRNMFAKSPAGRPGIADEVANVAELLLSNAGAFITGSDFLIDGGATASYFYGPLQPENR